MPGSAVGYPQNHSHTMPKIPHGPQILSNTGQVQKGIQMVQGHQNHFLEDGIRLGHP